jgi:hypothetical protein
MRLLPGVFVVAALVVPVNSQGQAASAPSKADVQKLLDVRDDARHKGDWSAYGQVFTADATSTNSDGKTYKGRAQIQKAGQDLWGAGVYKGARMKSVVESNESTRSGSHRHRFSYRGGGLRGAIGSCGSRSPTAPE